jgi:hypothetical protein
MRRYVAVGAILMCILFAPLLPLWMAIAASERATHRRNRELLKRANLPVAPGRASMGDFRSDTENAIAALRERLDKLEAGHSKIREILDALHLATPPAAPPGSPGEMAGASEAAPPAAPPAAEPAAPAEPGQTPPPAPSPAPPGSADLAAPQP